MKRQASPPPPPTLPVIVLEFQLRCFSYLVFPLTVFPAYWSLVTMYVLVPFL